MQIKSGDEELLTLLKESKSVALITGSPAGVDVIGTMMSFYHQFKSNSLKITVVVPEEVPEACQNIPESSVIKSSLGPKNLLVSLDTQGSPLSKITYFQEGSVFNLVIHPKDRSFSVERIRYSYEGAKFDAFILFGVLRLADLGELLSNNQKEFRETTIINLDYRSQNERYGSINIIDESSSSLSEAFFRRLNSWSLIPNKDSALALLTALSAGYSEPPKDVRGKVTEEGANAHDKGKFLAKESESLIQ